MCHCIPLCCVCSISIYDSPYYYRKRLIECMHSLRISYDWHSRIIPFILGYIIHGVSTITMIYMFFHSISARIILRQHHFHYITQVFRNAMWIDDYSSIFAAQWNFENYRVLDCNCSRINCELCRTNIAQRRERTKRYDHTHTNQIIRQ